jgi:hypothetical protein
MSLGLTFPDVKNPINATKSQQHRHITIYARDIETRKDRENDELIA